MGFLHDLRAAHRRDTASGPRPKNLVYVAYDQLSTSIGALARAIPEETCIVLVENAHKAKRRPYHRQKLALVLANQRHFALACARAGYTVRTVVGDAPYRDLLAPIAREFGALTMMRAAERELRVDLAPLVDEGALRVIDHDGFLTTAAQFERHAGTRAPWRMDRFYRGVRAETGVLMEGAHPVGGRFSFDDENREPWRGEPPAPEPPTFPIDDVKREVAALVAADFAAHPGEIDLARLPATDDDARALWSHAKDALLASFGPYEDAMSTRSSTLFHTRVSSLVNLHRLLPRALVDDVARLDIPLQSKEGFVRQVLGWREFVRHVHDRTDGFRALSMTTAREAPGDAGYAAYRGEPFLASRDPRIDGGAAARDDEGATTLPPAYWGARSGLACLDHVVDGVWREGWSHHITRLMVLSNIATLLDVDARALTDWFWVAYTDAYDWVVEPNVLAMGTFSVDVMTTKPYVAGSAYIDRMSDFCDGCAFSPKKDCPITPLYWAYLARHGRALAKNPRMKLPLAALARRAPERRDEDAATFVAVRETLARGEALVPLQKAPRRRA